MNNFKYIKFFLGSVLLSIIAYSCVERIDIDTDDAPPRLVVYGYITTDTMQHSIRITRSSGYFSTTRPEGISNAIVKISTDDKEFTLLENPKEPGLYQTEANVYGVEGKTYKLNVLVDFNNDGKKEELEASSYLPLAIRFDTLAINEKSAIKDHMEILFYGRMPDNDRNFLSMHAYINNKIANDSLQNYFIIDDEYMSKKDIDGVPCFYLDQEIESHKVNRGDTITLQVDVLTKEYADFIENGQDEVRGSLPIFSGPPANIQTNIKNKNTSSKTPISGFFSAYSSRKKSTIFK